MRRTSAILPAIGLLAALAACTPATPESPTPSATTSEAPTSTGSPRETPTPTPSPSETPTSGNHDQLTDALEQIKTISFAEGPQNSADFPALNGEYLATGVRAATDADVERVILTFQGEGTLEWNATWVDEAISDGKGDTVNVGGQHILELTISGVRNPEVGEEGNLLAALPATQVITDIQAQYPFEGMQKVFIGTSQEAPYRVYFDQKSGILILEFQK